MDRRQFIHTLNALTVGSAAPATALADSSQSVSSSTAATDLAIGHPFLGQRRLQQASAVLVAIEGTPNALQARDSISIMLRVRNLLPPDSWAFYSRVSTQPDDGHDFRVSILACGIQEI